MNAKVRVLTLVSAYLAAAIVVCPFARAEELSPQEIQELCRHPEWGSTARSRELCQQAQQQPRPPDCSTACYQDQSKCIQQANDEARSHMSFFDPSTISSADYLHEQHEAADKRQDELDNICKPVLEHCLSECR
jgi:hypothetical protein